jgi:hypothetical protein
MSGFIEVDAKAQTSGKEDSALRKYTRRNWAIITLIAAVGLGFYSLLAFDKDDFALKDVRSVEEIVTDQKKASEETTAKKILAQEKQREDAVLAKALARSKPIYDDEGNRIIKEGRDIIKLEAKAETHSYRFFTTGIFHVPAGKWCLGLNGDALKIVQQPKNGSIVKIEAINMEVGGTVGSVELEQNCPPPKK